MTEVRWQVVKGPWNQTFLRQSLFRHMTQTRRTDGRTDGQTTEIRTAPCEGCIPGITIRLFCVYTVTVYVVVCADEKYVCVKNCAENKNPPTQISDDRRCAAKWALCVIVKVVGNEWRIVRRANRKLLMGRTRRGNAKERREGTVSASKRDRRLLSVTRAYWQRRRLADLTHSPSASRVVPS